MFFKVVKGKLSVFDNIPEILYRDQCVCVSENIYPMKIIKV